MESLQQAGVPNGGEQLRRRGLVAAILGALTAGLFGKARPAQAQGTTSSLLLGEVNRAERETRLELVNGNVSNVPAFKGVANTGDMPFDLPPLPARGNIGLFGCADEGVGLWAASDTNIGAWGVAKTGVGVLGTTYPPDGDSPGPETPETYQPAGVYGNGNSQVGVWGTSMDNIANWGVAEKAPGIGVAGQGPHIGGWFMKGPAPADFDWKKLEPAALHTTAFDRDVSACFRAEKGVAVMAEAMDEQGVAAMLMGRIQSDMVGRSMIRRGEMMLVIPCSTVDDTRSHVSITFLNDVRANFWVELQTGKGFVVHLDKAAKADAVVTYLVVEMMDHDHSA